MAKQKTPFIEAIKTRYHVNEISGCWIWTGDRDKNGYGIWQTHKGRLPDGSYERKRERAHRLHWEHHNGPIAEGLLVLHHCDNPSCVRIDHLFLGTPSDNSKDMAAKGRSPRGERQGQSLFTAEQVIQIRNTHGTLAEIAARYGVSTGAIDDIKTRRTWKHIPGERIDDPKLNQGKAGSAHAGAILHEREIPIIRRLYADGMPIVEIAKRFGVSDMVIRHIIKGRTWKHVP
jgi:predicted DNA-binding protein YlxM (UPF0122 family)